MSLVKFADMNEFMSDLEADKDHISCVRICIKINSVNDGLDQVFVQAGFWVKVDDELRELEFYCGDDIGGNPAEGTGNAQDITKNLTHYIEGLGIEVRGGAYA